VSPFGWFNARCFRQRRDGRLRRLLRLAHGAEGGLARPDTLFAHRILRFGHFRFGRFFLTLFIEYASPVSGFFFRFLFGFDLLTEKVK
jgi:hypothetical protein